MKTKLLWPIFAAVLLLGLFLPSAVFYMQDSRVFSAEDTFQLPDFGSPETRMTALDMLRLVRLEQDPELMNIGVSNLNLTAGEVCTIAKECVQSIANNPQWKLCSAEPKLLTFSGTELQVWAVSLTWDDRNYGSFLIEDSSGHILQFTLSFTEELPEAEENMRQFLQAHFRLQSCQWELAPWLRFLDESGESDLFSLSMHNHSILFNHKYPN